MPYAITITADTPEELATLIAGLTGTASAAAPTPVAAKTPEQAVAAKAPPKKAPAKKTDPEPASEPETVSEQEPETAPPSDEDFATTSRELVLAIVEKKGRDAMESILSKYGVARASQVDEDRRSELLVDLREALAA